MATCYSILAWKVPGTEKPGRLQSMGLQRVRHDWATERTSSWGVLSLWKCWEPWSGSNDQEQGEESWRPPAELQEREMRTKPDPTWEGCKGDPRGSRLTRKPPSEIEGCVAPLLKASSTGEEVGISTGSCVGHHQMGRRVWVRADLQGALNFSPRWRYTRCEPQLVYFRWSPLEVIGTTVLGPSAPLCFVWWPLRCCHSVVDTDYSVLNRVPPRFVCWSPRSQSNDTRRWGL